MKLKNGYAVRDMFNGRTISRHRTLGAAHKAEERFQRAFGRANSLSSYMPTDIMRIDDGKLARLSEEERNDLCAMQAE